MGTTINARAAGPLSANVWIDTNRVSSDGKVKEVTLEGLPAEAKDAAGTWAKVDGKTKLGGIFKWEPFATNPEPPAETTTPEYPPYDDWGDMRKKRKPKHPKTPETPKEPSEPAKPKPPATATSDGFDQVQLYSSLTGLALSLSTLGFDMAKIIGESKNGRIVAHANAVEDMNAWFSPQDEEETYGTSDGKWHLASDDDVTRHETGHFVLYRLIPSLLGWQSREGVTESGGREGGAIHEGFGDAMSALLANDPEVSEDFPPAMGDPADKGKGLRTVDQDIDLQQSGTEVHDRGQVYAGFWWSLKKKLEDQSGPYRLSSREAADAVLKLLMNHAAFYRTNAPKPADFVKAVLAGTEALVKEGKLPASVVFADLQKDINSEAIKRKMIKTAADTETKDVVAAGGKLNIETLRKNLAASGRIIFSKDPDQRTTGIGGTREFYQEWVKLDDAHTARVLGGGFSVFRDASGAILGYSRRDVVSKLPFSPTTKVNLLAGGKTAADAVVIARSKAQQELGRASEELKKVKQRLPLVVGREDYKALKEAQKKFRVAKAAEEKAAKLTEKDTELVIVPGQKDAHYEVKMGLSLYYVNVRTGETTAKDDVLWD